MIINLGTLKPHICIGAKPPAPSTQTLKRCFLVRESFHESDSSRSCHGAGEIWTILPVEPFAPVSSAGSVCHPMARLRRDPPGAESKPGPACRTVTEGEWPERTGACSTHGDATRVSEA